MGRCIVDFKTLDLIFEFNISKLFVKDEKRCILQE